MTTNKMRVVLVSGAARGIGYEIAAAFAAKGHRVALLDVAEEVEKAASDIRALGGDAVAIRADVTDEDSVKRSVEDVISNLGEVGILVNNAAVSGRIGKSETAVDQIDPEIWRRVINTNVTSAFLLSRACIPSMQRVGWGRIINMSSQAARARIDRANAHYAASKAALLGFTRALAMEVGGFGVTVNSIAPGRVATQLSALMGHESDIAYSAKAAVGRVGTTAEIAAAAIFLADDENSFITGAVLDVNGGYSIT